MRQIFYRILFGRCPALQQTMNEDRKDALRSAFNRGVQIMMDYSGDPDKLERELSILAGDCIKTEVPLECLDILAIVIIETLAELFGSDWDSQLEAAWDEAIGLGTLIISRAVTSRPNQLA